MSTDYAALADSIKIEDITSNTHNKSILQRLKDNDNSFDKLTIRHRINVTYGLIDPKSYATFDDDGDSEIHTNTFLPPAITIALLLTPFSP